MASGCDTLVWARGLLACKADGDGVCGAARLGLDRWPWNDGLVPCIRTGRLGGESQGVKMSLGLVACLGELGRVVGRQTDAPPIST